MKQALSSLNINRWLRVVAIAGVVMASAATVADAKAGDNTKGRMSSSISNSWCPRC